MSEEIMEYIIDKEAKYSKKILKYLTSYNISYIGIRTTDKIYIHILDNKNLVSALTANLRWDALYIDEHYYNNFEILKLMVSQLSKIYKSKANAIRVETNFLEKINVYRFASS